jgi:hypothetical protein
LAVDLIDNRSGIDLVERNSKEFFSAWKKTAGGKSKTMLYYVTKPQLFYEIHDVRGGYAELHEDLTAPEYEVYDFCSKAVYQVLSEALEPPQMGSWARCINPEGWGRPLAVNCHRESLTPYQKLSEDECLRGIIFDLRLAANFRESLYVRHHAGITLCIKQGPLTVTVRSTSSPKTWQRVVVCWEDWQNSSLASIRLPNLLGYVSYHPT